MGLPAYNLTENPFEPRVLDPWRTPRDAELLDGGNGLGDLTRLETFFAEHPRAAGQPMFIVVTGDPGTGRTSAVNYLIYLWAKQAQVKQDLLAIYSTTVKGESEAKALYKLVLDLGYEIRTRARLMPATESELRELRMSQPDGLDTTLKQTIQMIYRDLETIENSPVVPVILERLTTANLVANAMDVFRHAGTLVVFVPDSSYLKRGQIDPETEQKTREISWSVRLHLLSGQEVKNLVETRWKARSEAPVPFNLSGMEEAFATERRTITRVLRIVSMMLEFKQVDFERDGLWPENKRLYLDTDEIRSKLRIIESRSDFIN